MAIFARSVVLVCSVGFFGVSVTSSTTPSTTATSTGDTTPLVTEATADTSATSPATTSASTNPDTTAPQTQSTEPSIDSEILTGGHVGIVLQHCFALDNNAFMAYTAKMEKRTPDLMNLSDAQKEALTSKLQDALKTKYPEAEKMTMSDCEKAVDVIADVINSENIGGAGGATVGGGMTISSVSLLGGNSKEGMKIMALFGIKKEDIEHAINIGIHCGNKVGSAQDREEFGKYVEAKIVRGALGVDTKAFEVRAGRSFSLGSIRTEDIMICPRRVVHCP